MHEYTHAVTDHVADLSYGYSQTGAIHEGNSDYFAAAFTGRTLINEYACYGYSIHQRNIASPRITNFSQYQQAQYYNPYQIYEPHVGGELWSRCLWDLRSHQSIGWVADYLIYYGLFGIPTTSSFLQYRQAIINADINYFSGAHKKIIEHLFYTRGIGPDSLGVTISGPSGVYHADPKGTPPNCYSWTAGATGGTPPYSYTWTGSYGTPSGANYNECFSWNGFDGGSYQYTLRVEVTDAQSNTASTTKLITGYNSGEMWFGIADQQASSIAIPEEFAVMQNYPNPFNPETEIRFALPEPSSVTVTVTDMLGREVVTLADRNYEAGYQRVLWKGVDASGRPVGSGVYFCRVTATGQSGKQLVKVMKMSLTR
ncbi:MAG: M36 family metallopeptidase [Bacteroidota bacterium]